MFCFVNCLAKIMLLTQLTMTSAKTADFHATKIQQFSDQHNNFLKILAESVAYVKKMPYLCCP